MLSWKLALQNKLFVQKLILSFLFLGLVLYFFAWFLNYIEQRQGHVFYDPVLNFLHPRDVSDFIFYTTYGAAFIGLCYAFVNPYRTLHICQMYTLLTICRIITLFIFPLDPPTNIIPLKDSILENTFYNHVGGNVKDLFFSGHTATLFLFFFFTKHQTLKWFFFTCAIAVAVFVVIQHIHYSYDVIVAPLFAYFCYKMISRHSKLYESNNIAALE